MKLTFSLIKHVEITAKCPKCGEETGTDCGHCDPRYMKPVQEFWCEKCGDFELPINWGNEINKAIKAATDAS